MNFITYWSALSRNRNVLISRHSDSMIKFFLRFLSGTYWLINPICKRESERQVFLFVFSVACWTAVFYSIKEICYKSIIIELKKRMSYFDVSISKERFLTVTIAVPNPTDREPAAPYRFFALLQIFSSNFVKFVNFIIKSIAFYS